MAYLTNTVLNNLQVNGLLNDKRVSKYGIVNLVKDSSKFVDYIMPSAREALTKMSGARQADIPIIKDQTVTVGSTPGFDYIPSNFAETTTFHFSPVNIFTGMRLIPSSFDNNVVDIEEYRKNVLDNILQGVAQQAESLLSTVLESRKTQKLGYTTQVSAGDGTFTFNESTDILTINKAAVKENMFFNLQTLMEANKLGGNYRLVTSPAGLAAQKAEAMKYGTENTKNLMWNDAMFNLDRRYESHQIDPSTDLFHGFFVRDGAIGVIENYPYDFRKGTTIKGMKWSISDVPLPYINMRANVYYNSEATEATSYVDSNDSNLIMTTFEEMALWFRFYIVYRYNEDLSTKPNDIVKLIGATS